MSSSWLLEATTKETTQSLGREIWKEMLGDSSPELAGPQVPNAGLQIGDLEQLRDPQLLVPQARQRRLTLLDLRGIASRRQEGVKMYHYSNVFTDLHIYI